MTNCRANFEVMPVCIHEPQNLPFSPPMPDTLAVRAATSATEFESTARRRGDKKHLAIH